VSIVLDNGRIPEAEFINYNYDVDGKRKGCGTVVAFDREGFGGERLFVTWIVYPSRDDEYIWWAETGHYGQTWEEAVDDAMKRFEQFKSNKIGDW
jgi:hypothetical protein